MRTIPHSHPVPTAPGGGHAQACGQQFVIGPPVFPLYGSAPESQSLREEPGDPITDYRNVLIASWAARRLGLSSLETLRYARDLLIADREEPGSADVTRKVTADLRHAGLNVSAREVRRRVLEAHQAVLHKLLSPA